MGGEEIMTGGRGRGRPFILAPPNAALGEKNNRRLARLKEGTRGRGGGEEEL